MNYILYFSFIYYNIKFFSINCLDLFNIQNIIYKYIPYQVELARQSMTYLLHPSLSLIMFGSSLRVHPVSSLS